MGMIYKYGLNDNKLAVDYFSQFLNDTPAHDLAVVAKLELEDSKATIGLPKQQASDPVATSVAAPHQFALAQNYPNPFNPETEIRYQLPENCQVSLVIYNLLGQQIRMLVENQQPAGFHAVRWDGKDEHGHNLASGIYTYRLEAGSYVASKKLALVR
jgi:flagellar hook assembly protein FlgD